MATVYRLVMQLCSSSAVISRTLSLSACATTIHVAAAVGKAVSGRHAAASDGCAASVAALLCFCCASVRLVDLELLVV